MRVFRCHVSTLHDRYFECLQGYFMLEDPGLFGYDVGSSTHRQIAAGVKDEAELLFRLAHPNIVRLHGIFLDPGNGLPKYLIMERAEGTLRRWLHRKGRITMAELALICRDILRGLVFIHSLSPPIAHRDLKDDNVLVFVDGDSVTAKLCDVDLARIATMSGRVSAKGGAPMYVAPEVATGSAGIKMDVFSFGIMVAEIVLVYFESDGTVEINVMREFGVDGRMRMVEASLAKLSSHVVFAAMLRKCAKLDPLKRLSSQEALRFAELLCADVEHARIIAEKDRLLRDKDTAIADKDRLLREKERQVSQVSGCWDWRILSHCTISVSFCITSNANCSPVVVCCADGNSGTSQVHSGVVCCPVIVVCAVVVCVCSLSKSAHYNHRCVVMLPLYALLRVRLGW
jgi:serine/threonine protein kinase